MTPEPRPTTTANRRTFLRTATAALAVPTAAVLVGEALSGTAHAATATASTDLPDFAPVPTAATGPRSTSRATSSAASRATCTG